MIASITVGTVQWLGTGPHEQINLAREAWLPNFESPRALVENQRLIHERCRHLSQRLRSGSTSNSDSDSITCSPGKPNIIDQESGQ